MVSKELSKYHIFPEKFKTHLFSLRPCSSIPLFLVYVAERGPGAEKTFKWPAWAAEKKESGAFLLVPSATDQRR